MRCFVEQKTLTLNPGAKVIAHADGRSVFFAANGLYGLADESGKELVPPRWNSVQPFAEGMAAVRRGEKWGFIDKTGREVFEPQWLAVRSFCNGYALATNGVENSCFLSLDGKIHSISSDVDTGSISDVFLRDGKPFYATVSNGIASIKEVASGKSDESVSNVYDVSGMQLILRKESLMGPHCGLYDLQSAKTSPIKFERVFSRVEGSQSASVALKGENVIILHQDMTPGPKYKVALAQDNLEQAWFTHGMLLVRTSANGKQLFRFYDTDRKEWLPMVYADAKPFFCGSAVVKLNNQWYLINRDGECITTGFDSLEGNGRWLTGISDGACILLDRMAEEKDLPAIQSLQSYANGLLQPAQNSEDEDLYRTDYLCSPWLECPDTTQMHILIDDYAHSLFDGKAVVSPSEAAKGAQHSFLRADDPDGRTPAFHCSLCATGSDADVYHLLIEKRRSTTGRLLVRVIISDLCCFSDNAPKTGYAHHHLMLPNPLPFMHGCEQPEGSTLEQDKTDLESDRRWYCLTLPKETTGLTAAAAAYDRLLAQALGCSMQIVDNRHLFFSKLAAEIERDNVVAVTECSGLKWTVTVSRDTAFGKPCEAEPEKWPAMEPSPPEEARKEDAWQPQARLIFSRHMSRQAYADMINEYFARLPQEWDIGSFEGLYHYEYIRHPNPCHNTLRTPHGISCAFILREKEEKGGVMIQAIISPTFTLAD